MYNYMKSITICALQTSCQRCSRWLVLIQVTSICLRLWLGVYVRLTLWLWTLLIGIPLLRGRRRWALSLWYGSSMQAANIQGGNLWKLSICLCLPRTDRLESEILQMEASKGNFQGTESLRGICHPHNLYQEALWLWNAIRTSHLLLARRSI